MIVSVLTVVCALFSFINYRFLKLPSTIGLMLISLVCALIVIIEGHVSNQFHDYIASNIQNVNFSETLLNVMLSFLLFAGALHVNISDLKKHSASISIFSTAGVALSTFLFGTTIYFIFGLFSIQIDFIYCLLFGAIVSPTDPIAVLGLLREAKIPKDIEVIINGESLFNDGIGVVFFVTIMQVIKNGVENLSYSAILIFFSREVFGGLALGIALGYAAYYLIKKIDDYKIEVLISLATVMISDELAHLFHVSGPLAVIAAGLIIGNKVTHSVMSEKSADYHNKFWELIDDFLNAALFVLIGLQLVIMPFLGKYFIIAAISVIILLICRYISVIIPIKFFKDKKLYNASTALIMTWGGLRGGLSIALTLILPEGPYKEIIVAITYIIVLFSVVVQGLTTGKVARKLFPG